MAGTQIKYDSNREWKKESLWKRNRPLCGAKCRSGKSCRAKAVWDKKRNIPVNGRCRMHGGLSTGPRTQEGLDRLRKATSERMKLYWKKKRLHQEHESLSKQIQLLEAIQDGLG
jgi:hypothetical protein